MKFILGLGFLIILLVNIFSTTARKLTNDVIINSRFSENALIHQLYEMFRTLMKLGDAEKNIPIMDPYTFNAEKIQVSAFIGEVNITNGMISGFSNFELEKMAFIKDELALAVILRIPSVQFKAEYYEMQGEVLGFVPIAGSGLLYVIVNDIAIYTNIYLKQSEDGRSIMIDKLENTSFAIEKILSHTDYDKNIDGVLNKMIEDLLAGYLTRFSKFISNRYKDYVVSSLNSILCAYDTWSILSMILS